MCYLEGVLDDTMRYADTTLSTLLLYKVDKMRISLPEAKKRKCPGIMIIKRNRIRYINNIKLIIYLLGYAKIQDTSNIIKY